jgi:GR25 family glycosyltransferase involved in LPS biosynthesis
LIASIGQQQYIISTLFKLRGESMRVGMKFLGACLIAVTQFCCVSLHGSLEDHLKPVSNKSEATAFENIDCIYVINLDQRPEKYALTTSQLEPWGIHPCRFSAVNGWELSFEALNDIGVKYQPWMRKNLWGTSYLPEDKGIPSHEVMHKIGKNYFCHCMSRGVVGIVLSHLSVLKDAYESGYHRIWVMEDDIYIPAGSDPRDVCGLIDELDRLVGKDGWDIFFTDTDTKSQKGENVSCYSCAPRPDMDPKDPYKFAKRRNLSKHFMEVGARYGAYSMIVNRCGMEKLLDYYKKYPIFLPFDMEYILPDNIKLISCKQDVVTTLSNALSDNKAPNYEIRD